MRNRSRYAPDNQVERAAELALKHGVALALKADGSVVILGRLLDTAQPKADGAPLEDADAALAEWEARGGSRGRS